MGEPRLADLLQRASLIEFHDEIRLVGLEISGRIIESEMTVLADADKRDINGCRTQGRASPANIFGGIGITVKQVILRDASFFNPLFEEHLAEASGRSDGQTNRC